MYSRKKICVSHILNCTRLIPVSQLELLTVFWTNPFLIQLFSHLLYHMSK